MELKTLKNILKDLQYAFGKQKWIADAGEQFYNEYQRRANNIEELKGMIADIERKSKGFQKLPGGVALPNIRIPLEITVEVERYLDPERMDHMEKGAAIGKPREGRT